MDLEFQKAIAWIVPDPGHLGLYFFIMKSEGISLQNHVFSS